MKVPSRWLPFVEACAGLPAAGRLQARAEQLLEEHRAGRSRRLARSLPRRKAARAGQEARTGARAALRRAAVTRAGGRCEATGVDLPARTLQLDHMFGRARSENIETVWMLSPEAHLDKTENRPSRRWWLERFRRHALKHGYGRATTMVDQLLALEPQEAP